MPIRPIDIQTNIAHMHEVGKNEQAKTNAIAEQQHLLDEESDEKSKLSKSKLEELKKGEKTFIQDEEKESAGKRRGKKKKKEEKEEGRPLRGDEKLGKIIDVLK